MRGWNEIDETFSQRPMESCLWRLKVKWKSMRRAGLEYNAPHINRRKGRLPSTGARTGRFARGVVIAYALGPCVRRTGNAQHWKLSSPETGFLLYRWIIAS